MRFLHYNQLFKDGFDERKLALSRDSQMLSDKIAEDYLRNDGMKSEIRSYLNHRRRARGGRPDTVQRDVDLITSCLSPEQNKHWLRIEHKTIQGNNVDEYILYGSELREHICAIEIYHSH